jgi:DUF2075 family protein
MKRKRRVPDFKLSEPEFLIGIMDRHLDWAVIICLIGGGQEINTGEAGLPEWFVALKKYPQWNVHVSNKLSDHEYTRGEDIFNIIENNLSINNELHLSVSLRSYRSEKVSALVKSILDINIEEAIKLYDETKTKYPFVITRDVSKAKAWLKSKARGTERYGFIASSGGHRLKPYGINVSDTIDPKNWFLNEKWDIRSSYFMEYIATEFDIQGLELDWVGIAWDANFTYSFNEWRYKAFKGTNWQNINKKLVMLYLKNTYRVLLTRARQGMVIFIPKGSSDDITRDPKYYDNTYEYLKRIGIMEI